MGAAGGCLHVGGAGGVTDALAFFNAAIEAAKTDSKLAYRLMLSAVQADPSFGPGWHNIACVQADSGMLHAAIAGWRRALQCDLDPAHRMYALTNIGHRLFAVGRLDEAWDWTLQAIAHDPGKAYPWENLSAICIQRGETAKAVEYARRGFEISREPVTEMQLSLALLNDGQFAEGLKHFEARFAYVVKEFLTYPHPRWASGHCARLLVVAEQGLGDTLSFARFIPVAAALVDEMVLVLPAELIRLLAPAMPENVTIWHKDYNGALPEADAFCPVMSIPHTLEMDDGEITATEGLDYGLDLWRRNPGDPLRVGISWAGSKDNGKDGFRSVPLEMLMDLFAIPGTTWVSLQTGERAEDLQRTGAAALVRDLAPTLRDAAVTAEVLAAEVDLVVTVDSFLGHLAGAVGRECYVMAARNAGDFRLGRHGTRVPLWYRKHCVFRQDATARWEPVIGRVKQAIEGLV